MDEMTFTPLSESNPLLAGVLAMLSLFFQQVSVMLFGPIYYLFSLFMPQTMPM